MPQNINFEHAAAMFGLDYARPDNWLQLQQRVAQCWLHAGVTVIEIVVSPSQGAETLQQLVQQVAQL
jgi:2-succinyl-5-enolpyruvyl-6-hydroxy-3-cyclohexene-1-carboxylate synthase